MADDLDDLLDEVESKFCSSTSKSKQSAYHLKQTEHSCTSPQDKKQSRKQESKGTENDDITAMLQEILEDDYQPINSYEPIATKTFTGDACSQTVSKKCCPVFLGGSSLQHGVGTSVSQRACNQLRCTSCDFRVAMFDDQEWDPSCDYLFLRNNMPDYHKLRAKLKRRKGGRAYACQCSWHTAHTLSDLRAQHRLKWVCGKHKA
ncbi:cilia- and flagella-associated protein 418 [Triplophysa dalaica]|uniref:cilia- and flagella-associated protein 418 n=1 Tax=Triplophysa dalaica TaxID=1582913 RepID=UPI0024DF636D|nr:cilia- and flagella-associated protein 418 [Triplophysa dalaica]